MSTALLNQILALLTIGSQVFIVVGIVYALIQRNQKGDFILRFFSSYAMFFAFLVALGATVGSLVYSDVLGYEPCNLCWYQRIFVYPSVILLGMAMIKKERNIIDYVLALSIVGTVISLYHNYISFGGNAVLPCPANGVSCTKLYVLEFGYITIPMMMLTAFALMIFLLVIGKYFGATSSR